MTTAITSLGTLKGKTATVQPIAPVQTHPARIHGTVEYREGDGPLIAIRRGPVGVQITKLDATLSWEEGETRGSAAMPIAIFRNYVARGAIKLDA